MSAQKRTYGEEDDVNNPAFWLKTGKDLGAIAVLLIFLANFLDRYLTHNEKTTDSLIEISRQIADSQERQSDAVQELADSVGGQQTLAIDAVAQSLGEIADAKRMEATNHERR